jgi:hypothetical protein
MSDNYVVLSSQSPRIDLEGRQGTSKRFSGHLRPKLLTGTPIDLTGCIVRAKFKESIKSATHLISLTSPTRISVVVTPPTATEPLKSQISFMLTPAETRLLKPTNAQETSNPVWGMEFEDALGNVVDLCFGECRFSPEIV